MEQSKIIKSLEKCFAKPNKDDEVVPLPDGYGMMDATTVMMVIPLSHIAVRLLSLFNVKDECDTSKIPELKYEKGHKSKISHGYISKAVALLGTCGDVLSISVAKDYPITLENEHFRVIIAPRID